MPLASRHSSRNDAVRGAPPHTALHSREILISVFVGIGYYFGVHAGFALTPESSPVSMAWPPNAILLAGFLLMPPRRWWLLVALVAPAHFGSELALGVPWNMAAFWFFTNVLEALLGASLIVRWLGGPPNFARVRDLSIFITAVLSAVLVASFLDAGSVAVVGWRYDEYWQIYRTRFFSNTLAALTFAPPLVIWFTMGIGLRRTGYLPLLEFVALFAGTCIASFVAFRNIYSPQFATVLYVPLPFLIWAALRYGVIGVTLCSAVVTGFAITAVLEGPIPSSIRSPENAVRTVQVFLIIAESSLMLLAAAFAELRRSKEAMARNEERLELALHSAEMGIWNWDFRADRVTWRSARDKSGFETRTRSRSSRHLLRLVHESDRAKVSQVFRDALRQRGSAELECRFVVGRRRHCWTAAKGRVLTDETGDPVRMIGVFLDITQRKNQELQTRVHREQLAHLGRVSVLGELSGAIAHELNQPLTSILLNAQATLRDLKGDSLDIAEMANSLQEIVDEDKRAGEVIRRLRALLLHGTVEMHPLDINECIGEVLLLENTDLIAHHVAIDLQLERPSPCVMGDRVQLQQVLLNLVINARDAMAGNAPEDRLLRIVSTREDGLVCVRVSDNGPGIRDTESIFEPFYSTKGHGIGMGLAICRSIITAHGGRVWASNADARGATFHLCMPSLSGEVGTTATAIRSPEAQRPTSERMASRSSSPSTGLRK